jgi:hypothetical protein
VEICRQKIPLSCAQSAAIYLYAIMRTIHSPFTKGENINKIAFKGELFKN